MPPGFFKTILQETTNASTGQAPVPKYHLDHDNPFESKYGENWRDEIDKRSELNNVVSIRKMVRHMHDESAKLFEGTEYTNTCSAGDVVVRS